MSLGTNLLKCVGLLSPKPTLPRMLTSFHEIAEAGWYDWWEFKTPDDCTVRVYAQCGTDQVVREARTRQG